MRPTTLNARVVYDTHYASRKSYAKSLCARVGYQCGIKLVHEILNYFGKIVWFLSKRKL